MGQLEKTLDSLDGESDGLRLCKCEAGADHFAQVSQSA